MTAAAPLGVVTFLFTHVEGSTRRREAGRPRCHAGRDGHTWCRSWTVRAETS